MRAPILEFSHLPSSHCDTSDNSVNVTLAWWEGAASRHLLQIMAMPPKPKQTHTHTHKQIEKKASPKPTLNPEALVGSLRDPSREPLKPLRGTSFWIAPWISRSSPTWSFRTSKRRSWAFLQVVEVQGFFQVQWECRVYTLGFVGLGIESLSLGFRVLGLLMGLLAVIIRRGFFWYAIKP